MVRVAIIHNGKTADFVVDIPSVTLEILTKLLIRRLGVTANDIVKICPASLTTKKQEEVLQELDDVEDEIYKDAPALTAPRLPRLVGCIHVGGLEGELEDEKKLVTLFGRYGTVLAATLRVRRGIKNGKAVVSWCVVVLDLFGPRWRTCLRSRSIAA